MYHLVYASSATTLMNDQDLIDLLAQAREKNERLNITGLLLYRGGNFLQVLEGPKETVLSVFESVRNDRRQAGLIVLSEGEIAGREFPDWPMGFQNLDRLSEEDIPGLSQFFEEPFSPDWLNDDPTRVQMILQTFREFIR
jgi:hypothetical protein